MLSELASPLQAKLEVHARKGRVAALPFSFMNSQFWRQHEQVRLLPGRIVALHTDSFVQAHHRIQLPRHLQVCYLKYFGGWLRSFQGAGTERSGVGPAPAPSSAGVPPFVPPCFEAVQGLFTH